MGSNSNKYIPVLDGIRAYAVLAVCWFHFFQVNESGLYETSKLFGILLFKVSSIGLRGVELFFILSGFLITGILLDSKKTSKYFTTFYARRILRIFPLYYFVLFISLFYLPHLYQIDQAGEEVIRNQIWLWTYASNLSNFWGFGGWDTSLNYPSFGHFWSLCVEEHFYLLWPLLIFITKEKTLPLIMWSIVLFSTLSVLIVYFFHDAVPFLKWSTIRCAGVLSLGALIAWYKRKPDVFERLAELSSRYIMPSFILFLLFNFIPRKYEIHDVLTYFSASIFFALLLTVSLKGNIWSKRLFDHKTLFFIGKISYGIYIYHGLLRPFMKEYLYQNLVTYIPYGIISSLIYTILCTAVSVLIAWLSWNILEKPVLKLKRVFSY
jgi:peptidoglycan/LPS O-acetylase OafA/YrhL